MDRQKELNYDQKNKYVLVITSCLISFLSGEWIGAKRARIESLEKFSDAIIKYRGDNISEDGDKEFKRTEDFKFDIRQKQNLRGSDLDKR